MEDQNLEFEYSENKIDQALKLYDTELNDEQVAKEVTTLLKKHLKENDTKEVKQFLLNSVELTTLKTTDSEDSVLKFVEKVNQFDDEYPELGHVATVCVYPNFAKICHDTLENEDVEIACVSGCFPSAQSFIEVKIAETALESEGDIGNRMSENSIEHHESFDYRHVCRSGLH